MMPTFVQCRPSFPAQEVLPLHVVVLVIVVATVVADVAVPDQLFYPLQCHPLFGLPLQWLRYDALLLFEGNIQVKVLQWPHLLPR